MLAFFLLFRFTIFFFLDSNKHSDKYSIGYIDLDGVSRGDLDNIMYIHLFISLKFRFKYEYIILRKCIAVFESI